MEAQEHVDGNAPEAKGKRARARTKSTAKETKEAVEKRSLNLRVDVETYERLTINAMKRRTTISDLVEGFAKGKPVDTREYGLPPCYGAKAEQGE